MPDYDEIDNEWPLGMCKVKEAWDLPLPNHDLGKAMGKDIIIAHPDTGYTYHPELLKGNRYLISPPNAKSFDNKFDEFNLNAADKMSLSASHGTTTASLMISDVGHPSTNPPNNNYPNYAVPINEFVTGIAPKAKVIPLRVTDWVVLESLPSSTYTTIANALCHALALNNVQIGVVSISLGGMRTHSKLHEALIKCRQEGLIICAAAGQNPDGLRNHFEFKKPIFPGNSPHTICVAGSPKDYSKPIEGFYGDAVDITAPGWGVIVARTTSEARRTRNPISIHNFEIDLNSNGTSYATALTAGACALWLAYHNRSRLIKTFGKPFLFDVFRHCLIQSCDKRLSHGGWPRDRGMGILDVEKLLSYPLPTVVEAERIAIANKWNNSHWGNSSNWGRL